MQRSDVQEDESDRLMRDNTPSEIGDETADIYTVHCINIYVLKIVSLSTRFYFECSL